MKVHLEERQGRLWVFTEYSKTLVARFRTLPGWRFHGEEKAWSFPLHGDVLRMVCDAVGVLPLFLPQHLRSLCGVGPAAIQKVDVDVAAIDNWKFTTQPFRHQRVNLVRLLNQKRWLVADEQGTGKSWVICNLLAWLTHWLSPGNRHHCLIVCPKSVLGTWRDQLAEHAGIACFEHVPAAEISRSVPVLPILINYERLLSTDCKDIAWQTIVFDEIHRLKNFTGQTHRIARKMSERAERVYGLSGTPAPNSIMDWLGVLSIIDPNLLPVRTKKDFESRYTIKERLPDTNVWLVKGYRNVEELYGYVAQVTSRFTKAECLDLPPKTITPRYVVLEGEQKRVYNDLKKDAVARLVSLKAQGTLSVKNCLSEALRLLQVVGGFVPDDDGQMHCLPEPAKLDALAEVVEDIGNRPLVVWCAFREEVLFLKDFLEALTKDRAVLLHGEMSSAAREESIRSFKDKQARFFIGTSAAGGTGINGLQVAATVVYYSRNWSLTDWLQSMDRLHRLGQTEPVSVIPLIAQGTIDQRVQEALTKKQDMLEMMLQKPEVF